MKKFRTVFSGFFLLFLIVCARAIFSQYDSKISISNDLVNEPLSIQLAHSALAPESIFPVGTGIFPQPEINQINEVVILKQNLDREKPIKALSENQRILVSKKPQKIATVKRFAKKSRATQKAAASELIHHESLQGTINTLPYERIKNIGVRFRYSSIPEEIIGHFWRFHSTDLRGKTIRINYSGIVPNEMVFLISRSYSSAKASYRLFLKDSSETRTISLTVPESTPFKDISIFEFQIVKSHAGKNYGDFLIEKVEIVSNHADDRHDKKEHHPRAFSFGGPYIQSNIWGGEILVS